MGKTNSRIENILTKDDFGSKFEQIDSNKSIYVSRSLCLDKLDNHIYRYVGFAYLVKMIQEKMFFVPNRQKFSDLREHSDYHFMVLEEFKNTIHSVPNYRSRKISKINQERHHQIWNQAVSCWTRDAHRSETIDENYLMWKCHSDKHFVCRIRTSINRFSHSLRNLSHDIIVSQIEYKPIGRFRTKDHPTEILVKPSFYIDEEEIRFVVLHNKLADCKMGKDIKLQFEPVEMIDEIILSPFINREEERILREQLGCVLGEAEVKIKSSLLMEYSK